MKEFKVEISVRPTGAGREVEVRVYPPHFGGVRVSRTCQVGEVRQTTLDVINTAFSEVLEV